MGNALVKEATMRFALVTCYQIQSFNLFRKSGYELFQPRLDKDVSTHIWTLIVGDFIQIFFVKNTKDKLALLAIVLLFAARMEIAKGTLPGFPNSTFIYTSLAQLSFLRKYAKENGHNAAFQVLNLACVFISVFRAIYVCKSIWIQAEASNEHPKVKAASILLPMLNLFVENQNIRAFIEATKRT